MRRPIPLCLALLLLLPLVASPAAAQRSQVEKATLEVAADRTAYTPGETARVAALLTIDPGWHVNSHEPTFEWLIPTLLEVEAPPNWQVTDIAYPPGEMRTFGFAEQPLSVYDGETYFVSTVAVPESAATGENTLTVSVLYQACDDSSCLPKVTAERQIELTVGAGGEPANEQIFAAAAGGGGETPRRATGPSVPSLLLFVGLGIVGGLILNAMPCVLPVLSLKVFGLVKSAGEGRRQVTVGGLATAAGILVSFWALAGAAVAAKAAGAAVGWGIQFQNPVFVTVLAIVIVLFSLNLWGLFEIPLPRGLARIGGGGGGGSVAGHFGSGLFATLMATPCSAPFLGSALGFALGQKAPVIFLIFTAVGFGMALPYLALAAAPGMVRWLPKPGPWMNVLRGIMGFLLAAAAIWLLYVLAAQVPAESVAFVQLGLLSLALFVWLGGRAASAHSRRLAAVGALLAVAATLAVPAGAGTAVAEEAVEASKLIDWVSFDRQQAEALAAEGRLVFVDVTADWCFTCKFNERLVLETEAVAGAFERHGVVAMKADWTNRNQAIGDYLAEFDRYGIPFYVLYRPGQDDPHLFSELLTTDAVLTAVEAAAAAAPASGREPLAP